MMNVFKIRLWKVIFPFLCLTLLWQGLLLAQFTKPDSGKSVEDALTITKSTIDDSTALDFESNYSIDFFAVIFRAFSSLAIIIVLILLTIYIVKRFLFLLRNHKYFNKEEITSSKN